MRSIVTVIGILFFAQTGSAQCNRACLEGFVNQYVEALVAHDPGRPLAPNAKYTENGVQLKLGEFDHNGHNKTITWNDGSVHPVNTPFDEPLSFLIGELFNIKNGKIYQIEALVLNVAYGMQPGWTK